MRAVFAAVTLAILLQTESNSGEVGCPEAKGPGPNTVSQGYPRPNNRHAERLTQATC
jgi:hypothetical protein